MQFRVSEELKLVGYAEYIPLQLCLASDCCADARMTRGLGFAPGQSVSIRLMYSEILCPYGRVLGIAIPRAGTHEYAKVISMRGGIDIGPTAPYEVAREFEGILDDRSYLKIKLV